MENIVQRGMKIFAKNVYFAKVDFRRKSSLPKTLYLCGFTGCFSGFEIHKSVRRT